MAKVTVDATPCFTGEILGLVSINLSINAAFFFFSSSTGRVLEVFALSVSLTIGCVRDNWSHYLVNHSLINQTRLG